MTEQAREPAASPWYTRPVVVVSDLARSLAFYVDGLGFAQDWCSVEDGRPDVAQVSRAGCELILCAHWPDRVGRSLLFVELTPQVLDALRTELAAKSIAHDTGRWGYELLIVRDPDGNTFYFPHEGDGGSAG